jgi:hypothetical protein
MARPVSSANYTVTCQRWSEGAYLVRWTHGSGLLCLLLVLDPFLALSDPQPVVTLVLVIGKSLQEVARESVSHSAVLQPMLFAAGLDGALIAPERLLDSDAANAVHTLPVFAFSA